MGKRYLINLPYSNKGNECILSIKEINKLQNISRKTGIPITRYVGKLIKINLKKEK